MKKLWLFRVGILITFMWCVGLPFFWAYNNAKQFQYEYFSVLSLYAPELIVAGFSCLFLSAAWLARSWAAVGLLVVALLAPILKFSIGSPTYGTWVVTALLLGAMAWSLYVLKKKENA